MSRYWFLLVLWTLVYQVQYSVANNKVPKDTKWKLSEKYNKSNVLVLNAYHQNYHWAEDIMSGVFSELGDKDSFELYIEYMDTKRCSDTAYYQKLRDIYLHKYNNVRIDVILACDDNALNFMLQYRDSIFPGVPVSFCGVVDYHSSRIEGKEQFSGVYETYDVPANLELIKSLHPKITKVAVISDLTESGKALIARVKRAEKLFKDKLSIEYLINEKPDLLQKHLQQLDEKTAVIWAIYLRLPDGRFISSEESIGFITSVTTRPVYCIWDVVGQGVVGGKITTPFYQGAEAARIAKRILAGETVSEIEVSGSPMYYKFDYNVLRQFNIQSNTLPEDSKLINEPISFWEANKAIASSLFAIIISLLTVVVTLSYLYRKSKRVEFEIKHKNTKLNEIKNTLLETNHELVESKLKAEESDRLKTAFLANLSHEIRTPMNGILGFTALIKCNRLSHEELLRYINIIDQSGNRLINLIDDLINISQIEAGLVTIASDITNIALLVDGVFALFEPQAAQKGLSLECEKELKGTVAVITDKLKLEQVLSNLLSNALKFTEQGSIKIKCTLSDKHMIFSVKDTGVGVAAEKQHEIFERFQQADNSYLKATEGMGLGLSISKSFVEKMGGTISVVSEEGKGSEFIVKLPAVLAEKSIEEPVNSPEPTIDKKIHILLAEDDRVNSEYIKEMLKNENFNIIHAENGSEAVQFFDKHPEINIILMDLKMPVMNGIDATKQIRKKDAHIPIIALTAYASDKDKLSAKKAGCTDFITKPVKKNHLLECLAISVELR